MLVFLFSQSLSQRETRLRSVIVFFVFYAVLFGLLVGRFDLMEKLGNVRAVGDGLILNERKLGGYTKIESFCKVTADKAGA